MFIWLNNLNQSFLVFICYTFLQIQKHKDVNKFRPFVHIHEHINLNTDIT